MAPRVYRFGEFTLSTESAELHRNGELVPTEPQVFDILRYLIENRESVVSVEDLVESIWKGRHIGNSTITSRIRTARQALGDSQKEQLYIRTYSRKGYRFVGKIDGFDGSESHSIQTLNNLNSDVVQERKNEATQSNQNKQENLEPKVGRHKPSIVVLPFILRGISENLAFLGDCLAEELIGTLSRSGLLFLIAPETSNQYRNHSPPVQEIRSQLNVKYIVHGSVMQHDYRFRVHIKLVDGETGEILQTLKAEREKGDVFDAVDELAGRIAGELLPGIASSERDRFRARHHNDLGAWGLYFRAASLIQKTTPSDCEQAIILLVRSVKMSEDFAPAHARLALCHVQAGYYEWFGRSGKEHLSDAFYRADLALVADPQEPLAYDALASAHQLDRNPEKALVYARKAISISPVCSSAYGTLISSLAMLGRAEEALIQYENCRTVSPRDPYRSGSLMGLIIAHYSIGNYEKTFQLTNDHLILRPNWYGSHLFRAAAAAKIGDNVEAERSIRQLLKVRPNHTLKKQKEQTYLKQASDITHLLEGLAEAGLPPGE